MFEKYNCCIVKHFNLENAIPIDSIHYTDRAKVFNIILLPSETIQL